MKNKMQKVINEAYELGLNDTIKYLNEIIKDVELKIDKIKKLHKSDNLNVIKYLEERKKYYNNLHENKLKDGKTHYYDELLIIEELNHLIEHFEEMIIND